MGSASLDVLFDKINREAAQFIQERTLVAMRLFLKEMGRGLSVTKAAKKTGVAVFTVRRWVFRSVSGGAFPSSFRDLMQVHPFRKLAHTRQRKRHPQPGNHPKGRSRTI